MTPFSRSIVLAAGLLGCLQPALGNDIGAMAIGGLTFSRTGGIVVDAEEIRIGIDSVSARYQLINSSSGPVTLTIAFPLPDIDLSEPDHVALPATDPVNFVGAETKIDGRPIKLSFNQRAWLGDKDVTAQLLQLQFPLLPVGPREVRIADLPASTRDRLVAAGLLTTLGTGEGGIPIYGFGWIVKTTATRQQTIPSDPKPVTIEHRYKPIIGLATDTILRKPLRQNRNMAAEIARRVQDYCTTDALYAGIDKLAAKGPVRERYLTYAVRGIKFQEAPIRSFRLTIDPGKERLAAFCAAGLTPVAGRPLEYEASNFTPPAEYKLLVLGQQ